MPTELKHGQITPLDQDNKDKPDYAAVFTYIETNCSEFLAAVVKAKKFLYRGINKAPDSYAIVGKPLKNRKPRDSSLELQKQFDRLLTLAGFEALRSNSIFATSMYSSASTYGNVYAIFPLDGYKFTYSEVWDDIILDDNSELFSPAAEDDIEDLIEDLGFALRDFVENIMYSKEYATLPNYTEVEQKINKYFAPLLARLLKAEYQASTPKLFIYLVDSAANFINGMANGPAKKEGLDLLKQFKKDYEKCKRIGLLNKAEEAKEIIIVNNKFRQTDMAKAIKSGNETLINGTYLAVRYTKAFEKLFKRRYF
jgi:hypothetical protein